MTEFEKYRSRLDALLRESRAKKRAAPQSTGQWIDRLTEVGDKAIISVTLTSLLKKAVDPGQDVRKHQVKMAGGYSGRGLDHKVTTPFLQENGFPAMAESGWLTRSFEQNAEYTLDYPGAIKKCKDEFLCILDAVEEGGANAADMVVYFLQRLAERREHQNVVLSTPSGLTVRDVARILEEHFSARYGTHGAARLPTLAVHAIYQQMLAEVGRYKGCTLGDLKSHTAADRRTGSLGDVEIKSGKSIFEAIEVKHDQPVTAQMVRAAFEKFKSKHSLKRYYILTTRKADKDDGDEAEAVTEAVVDVSLKHGCQVIVNGVIESLKYYLRLLRSTDEFIHNYVTLLEAEPAIAYEHKDMWNKIIGKKRDNIDKMKKI